MLLGPAIYAVCGLLGALARFWLTYTRHLARSHRIGWSTHHLSPRSRPRCDHAGVHRGNAQSPRHTLRCCCYIAGGGISHRKSSRENRPDEGVFVYLTFSSPLTGRREMVSLWSARYSHEAVRGSPLAERKGMVSIYLLKACERRKAVADHLSIPFRDVGLDPVSANVRPVVRTVKLGTLYFPLLCSRSFPASYLLSSLQSRSHQRRLSDNDSITRQQPHIKLHPPTITSPHLYLTLTITRTIR